MLSLSELLPRACIFLCVLLGLASGVRGQAGFEGPPIDYLNAPVHDPVSRLAGQLESGELKLDYTDKQGYLLAVLEALEIPVSSQTLVFSKTSLQLQRISPSRPRAIYFNDDVYVGYCQRGETLEFAANDPQQGPTFYTLKQDPTEPPKLVRDRGQCLSCHASSRTQNVPGYLVRSVYPDQAGQPILGSGTFTTDHTSPFDERWGGWYVTGTHGSMRHMGNMTFTEEDSRQASREAGANLQSLPAFVSSDAYPSPHSDLIALMVLEHQTQMHNAITAANFETRQALHQSFQMNALLDRQSGFISESAERRIVSAADQLVSYLLMCDEFALQDPVAGTSGFERDFEARGIRDSQGRSLRDLDLNTRLFRYPCSYLIYNAAFDALPDEVRRLVLEKLIAVLTGRDDTAEFRHLTPPLRQEILEILLETKPEFATEFTNLQQDG